MLKYNHFQKNNNNTIDKDKSVTMFAVGNANEPIGNGP